MNKGLLIGAGVTLMNLASTLNCFYQAENNYNSGNYGEMSFLLSGGLIAGSCALRCFSETMNYFLRGSEKRVGVEAR